MTSDVNTHEQRIMLCMNVHAVHECSSCECSSCELLSIINFTDIFQSIGIFCMIETDVAFYVSPQHCIVFICIHAVIQPPTININRSTAR